MLESISSAFEALKTKPNATRAERIAANFPEYVKISFAGQAHIAPKKQNKIDGWIKASGWYGYIRELPRKMPDCIRPSNKKAEKDFFHGYDEAKNLFHSVG